MSLSLITQPAAGQLALWQMISPSPRPARKPPLDAMACVLETWELRRNIICHRVTRYSLGGSILEWLNLFSACKQLRGLLRHAVNWLKSVVTGELSSRPRLSPFCWDMLEGRSVGELAIVVNRFRGPSLSERPRRRIQFKGIVAVLVGVPEDQPSLVMGPLDSRIEDLDEFPGNVAYDWRTPFSPQIIAIGGVLLRYQQTGCLYEILMYGWGSWIMNMHKVHSLVANLGSSAATRDRFLASPERLEALRLFCNDSYAVMELTPAIPGESEPLFRQITGMHIGFNWRDIENWNAAHPNARVSLYPPAS